MKMLLQTSDTILVELDGKLEMLPNNDYTKLRIVKFGGSRITHDFGGGCRVSETYNRGIYNCECGGEMVQIYDGGVLARAILDGDTTAYREIFREWHCAKLQDEVVEVAIGAFRDRVRRRGGMYVVDGVWGVDTNGGAMFYHMDKWHNLCLVAGDTGNRTISLAGSPVHVNARTWIVIAKILFLLFPRPERVFMSQLPRVLRRRVEDTQILP